MSGSASSDRELVLQSGNAREGERAVAEPPGVPRGLRGGRRAGGARARASRSTTSSTPPTRSRCSSAALIGSGSSTSSTSPASRWSSACPTSSSQVPAWPGWSPRPQATERGARVVVHEKGTGPAGRCSSRAASCGGTASSRTSARSARAGNRRCSASSTSGSTGISPGSRGSVRVWSSASPAIARRSARASTPRSLTDALARRAGDAPARRAAARASRRHARGARDRRVPGRPRSRARADHARGRQPRPPRHALEHRRRPRARSLAREPPRRRGWRSSTGATCRRRRRGSTRREFVPLAQLYAHHAVVESDGETYEPATWSEIDVVQWTARRPGARATYRVATARLAERVGERTVGEMVAAAERAARRSTAARER